MQLPLMDVTLENLYHGDIRLGDLALDLRSEAGLIRAEGITGAVAGTRLPPETPGQLLWQPGGGGYTSLSGNFGFDDFGATLAQLGYERIVETDSGSCRTGSALARRTLGCFCRYWRGRYAA